MKYTIKTARTKQSNDRLFGLISTVNEALLVLTKEQIMTKKVKNNDAQIKAFISHKANIDAMLERLQKTSADHFGKSPEAIQWGDVALLSDIANELQDVTWRVFQEGEYA